MGIVSDEVRGTFQSDIEDTGVFRYTDLDECLCQSKPALFAASQASKARARDCEQANKGWRVSSRQCLAEGRSQPQRRQCMGEAFGSMINKSLLPAFERTAPYPTSAAAPRRILSISHTLLALPRHLFHLVTLQQLSMPHSELWFPPSSPACS